MSKNSRTPSTFDMPITPEMVLLAQILLLPRFPLPMLILLPHKGIETRPMSWKWNNAIEFTTLISKHTLYTFWTPSNVLRSRRPFWTPYIYDVIPTLMSLSESRNTFLPYYFQNSQRYGTILSRLIYSVRYLWEEWPPLLYL